MASAVTALRRFRALLQIVGGDKLIIPFADGAAHEPFKGRHFQRDIILWAVRWCCKYGISYREAARRCWLNAGECRRGSTIYRFLGSALCAEMEKRLRWYWRNPASIFARGTWMKPT